MNDHNINEVNVEQTGDMYRAYYKGNFATGYTRDDAIRKVKETYHSKLNKDEKAKKNSFTWTSFFAILSLVGLVAIIIAFVVLTFYADQFEWWYLLIIFCYIPYVGMMFELKAVVEKSNNR